jgi:hypothetical protein
MTTHSRYLSCIPKNPHKILLRTSLLVGCSSFVAILIPFLHKRLRRLGKARDVPETRQTKTKASVTCDTLSRRLRCILAPKDLYQERAVTERDAGAPWLLPSRTR